MPSQRSPATVLFVDMVGSTERASRLGDRRWRKLLQDFHARVRSEISSFGGRAVTSAGDGFLATFPHPERAILCGCALRDSLRPLEIEVRTGLHTGEIEEVGGSVGGIAVHIGARVAALAKAGEVLVSSTLRDVVEGSGFTFEDRGTHPLRGVPGEWRVYSVTGIPVEAADTESERRKRIRLPRPSRRRVALPMAAVVAGLILWILLRRGEPSGPPGPTEAGTADPAIAVLPFTVDDPRYDREREGMVHLLSAGLEGVESTGLRAIDSRTVLARWRERVHGDEAPDLRTALGVARDTGARYAVLGSLASAGRDIRLVGQVYDLERDRQIGRPSQSGDADGILTLADGLAIEVLRTILGGTFNLPRSTTKSLVAWRAYVEGEVQFQRSNFDGAVAADQRAVEADSTFAVAMGRLAMAYGWRDEITTPELRATVARLGRQFTRLPERDQLLLLASLAFVQRGEIQAIDALQNLVRKYPDDLEAWNLLGDAYYHLAGPALEPAGAVDAALSHALALDSTFTPAYIHLIEDALHRADRARVAHLVDAYARFAPGTRFDRRHRLWQALAFGDSAGREAALAALDTVPEGVLRSLVPGLRNPRFLGIQESVLRRVAERPDNPDSAWTGIYGFANVASQGRVEAALRELEGPRTPAWFRADGAYLLRTLQLPVPPGRLDRMAAGASVEDGDGELFPGSEAARAFFEGALAAERGDSAGLSAALSGLQGQEGRLASAGDSVGARFLRGAGDGLRGYVRWKKTRDPAALSLLDEARRTATGLGLPQIDVNCAIRWWQGEIALELGRPQEAETYWSSIERAPFSAWQHPLVTYRLAGIYEQLGERDRARAAYQVVATAWRGADREARALVSEPTGDQDGAAGSGPAVDRSRTAPGSSP